MFTRAWYEVKTFLIYSSRVSLFQNHPMKNQLTQHQSSRRQQRPQRQYYQQQLFSVGGHGHRPQQRDNRLLI